MEGKDSTGAERPDKKSCPETTVAAKDYIAHLFKENNAMKNLDKERNKMIEISEMELQKLKFSLQTASQQSWELSKANSQLLEELNLAKGRLKALQHELGCTAAVLKVKTSELENELNKQGRVRHKKINHEGTAKPSDCKIAGNTRKRSRKNWCLGPVRPAIDAHSETRKEKEKEILLVANCENIDNTVTKRTLRSRSLGLAIVAHEETGKDKKKVLLLDNCEKTDDTARRYPLRSRSLGPAIEAHRETGKAKEEARTRSLRRSSNLEVELHEESNELENEDAKLNVADSTKDETESKKTVGRSLRRRTGNLKAEMHEESKDYLENKDRRLIVADLTIFPHSQGQRGGLRRSSLGRPLRRAAEKVSSYKEVPLNVKMRRLY